MSDNSASTYSRVSRRRVLQVGSGLIGFGVGSSFTSTTAAADTGDQQWAFQTGGDIFSSPTVINGMVFVGSTDSNLYAVDAETGQEQWTFEAGDAVVSSPTVVDDTVFVGSIDGNLYAVDAETGTEQWVFETSGQVSSSPTVVDGTVFVGSHDDNLYSVDAETGRREWTFETDDEIWSSPTVVDGTVFVGSSDTNMYAVNAETSDQQWVIKTTGTDSVDSSPTVVGETVFVGGKDNYLYAANINTGKQKYIESSGYIDSSPTAVNGSVFFGSGDNNLYALTTETGEQQWTFETGGGIGSSPTVANGTIFVGSNDNNLYAVNANTGDQQWAFETGGEIWSSPTVVNGTVFFGSYDGNLYAVDAGVTGSSRGTRTWLGTLGHHGNWAYADQSITIASDDGIGMTGMAAVGGGGIAATLLGARILRQRESDDESKSGSSTSSDESTETGSVGNEQDAVNLTSKFNRIRSQLREARQSYQINGNYAKAIQTAENAVETAEDLIEIAESTAPNRLAEANELLDEATRLSKKITSERETYERASKKLDKISNGFDQASKYLDANEVIAAKDTIADGEELLETIESALADKSINTLDERLERLWSRCQSLKQKTSKKATTTIQVPNSIPTTDRLSIEYSDIKKQGQLGSGGNADVYRATAKTDDSEIEIALKEPQISGTMDRNTIDAMLSEAKTWQQLDDYDHIVSVVAYDSNPLPWIGMEYMDGGDLADRAGEMPFEQAIWTALMITKAVRHAHSRGVAHFDLKPENILFRSVETAWDVPKVADWGLSKQLLDHSNTVEGVSPHYAAPEQFDTDQYGKTDTVTDVYQLGAAFYELFTGRRPFEGSAYEIINKVKTETPPQPSSVADLPPVIDDILLTALATKKQDRYEDVIYLRDKFEYLFELL